jgi:hypothetical protein
MFDDAVIHPKHKETTERFFVEEIVRRMSPKNLLPNDKSMTFKSFYKIRHKQSITQDDQPLLRISNANKHHFMFAPISLNTGNHKVRNSTWKPAPSSFELQKFALVQDISLHSNL